ncbi:3992_t:CDS:2 [Gigaspora rosea]|nr:3992_t:CDS:2 [Gigaspora rosea]
MATVEESSKEPATKKQKHDKESKTKRKSLTSTQKAEICHLKQKGVSQVKLAERFSIAEATISSIVHKKEKVTPKNISNCWKKTSILPKGFLSELFLFEELDQINEHDITSEIQDLIMRLPLEQPMGAEEYIIADNDLITTEMPNDEEIIEAIKNHEYIEPEDEVLNKLIFSAQVVGFIDSILSFLEQQPDGSFNVDVSFIRNLEKLKKDVRLKHITSQCQATLDTFILISSAN